MAVTTDMARAWKQPRVVMRELLSAGRREDRALAILMAACFVIFVAQWPRLSRMAAVQETELSRLVAYEFFGWLMVWPLVFYALGGMLHLVAKLGGGKGSFYTARLALFWTLLASAPLALLYGLGTGLLGQVASTQLLGALWGLFVSFLLVTNLIEAEKQPEG